MSRQTCLPCDEVEAQETHRFFSVGESFSADVRILALQLNFAESKGGLWLDLISGALIKPFQQGHLARIFDTRPALRLPTAPSHAYNVAISQIEPAAASEAHLLLSLDTREVGRVTVVHCKGRIIGGRESESLRAHLAWLLHTRREFVLHLGDVGFIDSSGLGTMVRALTSTRQARGELKLCNVPDFVRRVLEMSRLTSVFDVHESEEKAVAAFYGPEARAEAPVPKGRSVLCLDSNADVLAYLRELLHRAGYDVQSSMRVSDALLLMRITHFDLLLVGPDMTASPAKPPAFQSACARLPVIELGSEFSTSDAGEACARLLETIEARLASKAV